MNNLQTIWANPHLRYCMILLAGLEIAGVWFPGHKAQLDTTSKIITFYAVAAAANSAPPTPPKPPGAPAV